MRDPNAVAALPAVSSGAGLNEILTHAQQASPQGRLTYLFNPALLPGEQVTAYMNLRSPEDFGHADVVRLDTRTGRVTSVWHYGANHSTGDWLLWAMQPLHFGTLWGAWVQAIWFCLGLMLALLTVSGVVMYWNRYLKQRWRALFHLASF